ncbi:MAG: 4Fe-4S dicluster domain-containing protein [Acidobacteriota bacterium]
MKELEDAHKLRPGQFAGDRDLKESVHPGSLWEDGVGGIYANGISRRRFLSLMSASAALAMGASCSKIDRGTIVPYTNRPEEIIPGVATYYASTFQEGCNVLGVLVKTREGRPILIEGNPDHPVSRGVVNLRAMADLLGLYDPDRLRSPSSIEGPVDWDGVEQAMIRAFESVDSVGKEVPEHRLDRAEVILSLQSDFLGVEEGASEAIRDFAAGRVIKEPKSGMNRLWVLEGVMTLTGANADERIPVRPSGIGALGFALIRLLNENHRVPLPPGLDAEALLRYSPVEIADALEVDISRLNLLSADLARAGASAAVLAGSSLPQEAHLACRLLNFMLGAEGNTVNSRAEFHVPRIMSHADFGKLLERAAGGAFAAAIFWGANPAYAFPDAKLWRTAVENIPDTFRIGLYEDETALDCKWRLPENHWLESWGDFQSSQDHVSLRQPAIGTLHDTRQGEDFLLSCMRRMGRQASSSYLEYLKFRWKDLLYPKGSPVAFEDYWNAALHDGGAPSDPSANTGTSPKNDGIGPALRSAVEKATPGGPGAMELVLLPGTGVYDGRYANNGWLNELPDPVTKATWGNPISISAMDAERIGVKTGDLVEVAAGQAKVEAPVLVQPGQCNGVASLALGYGRSTGNVAAGIGVNGYSFLNKHPEASFVISNIVIRSESGGAKKPIPFTQTHDRMDGRNLALSWTVGEYAQRVHEEMEHESHHEASLIPNPQFRKHKWGMAVDLSACVGCGACVIACQSENNIPVVGPERVLRGRHMHWIRVDRYYEGGSQNPEVRHQPMLCQHCDKAPCEIVCPVNATTHSEDGLNQMVYNRCVGTRYCSNNCPFKVRRFNYLDYTSTKTEPETLVFKPEVTVRPRGVMEKCTFCVQRIENAKQKAKVENRSIRDGEVQPACVRACPAGALVFGNTNDPESRIVGISKSDRHYRLLEELGIGPSVTYLVDISNPATGEEKV